MTTIQIPHARDWHGELHYLDDAGEIAELVDDYEVIEIEVDPQSLAWAGAATVDGYEISVPLALLRAIETAIAEYRDSLDVDEPSAVGGVERLPRPHVDPLPRQW